MTSEEARRPTLAELADLDAGLVDGREVDTRTAAVLRSEAALDPRSNEMLDALAATRAELAAAPLPAPPPADRWAAPFDDHPSADELAPRAAVVPLRSRGRAVRPALVAAAVLVGIAVVVGIVSARARPEVSRPQLAAAALEAIRVHDTAGFDDPVRRTGCLRAAAPELDPNAQLLAGRRVDFEGQPGVLLVLGTGKRGVLNVLVVDPECGPGAGGRLALVTVS